MKLKKEIITCDKCKKEIMLNKFPKLKIIRFKTLRLFSHNPYDYIDCKYDLCNECIKKFDEFMKGDSYDTQKN